MAEFCLQCFNKLSGTCYTARQVWLEDDFCEGCADWKPCVVALRHKLFFQRLNDKARKLNGDGFTIKLDNHIR